MEHHERVSAVTLPSSEVFLFWLKLYTSIYAEVSKELYVCARSSGNPSHLYLIIVTLHLTKHLNTMLL